jgi:hypothetical protein
VIEIMKLKALDGNAKEHIMPSEVNVMIVCLHIHGNGKWYSDMNM